MASTRSPLDPPSVASVYVSPTSRLPLVISQSGSLISNKPNDGVDIEPDELFARYTIPEVKTKQAQLRADAEAKQEDLRIMVGERYRDLLQASSSIISIATSAKRVQEALEEATTTIRSQKMPTIHSYISQSGKDDSHLQMLQILSAHIKLLLDAPEHLWRLIEREKYFQAAWLFLLARVVHRALIRDDTHDDEGWTQYGIDALEQFPLIQRQWEAVSHFRAQIIHRATLSLRVLDKTCEETCATLLTLHILDSRPLSETLTIYLSQRTRTLNGLLAKYLDIPEQLGSGTVTNGGPRETRKVSERETKLPAKTLAIAVKKLTTTTLEAVSRTVYTARAVFGMPASGRSLAVRVLDSIQSKPLSSLPASLPAELVLNTQTVLNSLPSSTYVSLLPASIQAYRPFVDLSSASSSLPLELLRDKLGNWFDQSTANFCGAFDKWLASLDVVSAVWKVRSSLRKWAEHSGLEAPEIAALVELLDKAFGTRIMAIWKAALVRAEKAFLQTLGSLKSDEDMFSPLFSLYRSPPVVQPHPSLHTYKEALRQRLEGRAPRLHETLRTLEDAAGLLQNDLSRMSADGDCNQRLVIDFTEAYRPEAEALCTRISSALKVSSEELIASPMFDGASNFECCKDNSPGMSKLIFHAHITKELSTSPFVCDIGCRQSVVASFREEMDILFERIMSRWEEYIISKLVSCHLPNVKTWPSRPGFTCTDPSPPVMECLYLLSSSIHNLGMSHHQTYKMAISKRMLGKFSAAVVQSIDNGDFPDTLQALNDLSFLRLITQKWKEVETAELEHAICRLRSHLADSSACDTDRSVLECLSRTQTLISALLPPVREATEAYSHATGSKMTGMLTYGVPVMDSHYVPAVELAPPSSRFPLLLVDAR